MKLILHFGLHRSASSALQRFLNQHHRPLRKRRVLSLSQHTAKAGAFRPLTLIKGIHIDSRGPRANHLRIERHLQSIGADIDAVIFSDENMPGLMIGDRGAAFSRAGRFAAMLALLAKNHDVHAVAIARHHANWLESIHRFSAGRGEPRDFAGFLARTDLDSINYSRLFDSVAAALGRERVHVFSYDAVKDDGGEGLLRHILGLAGTRLPGPLQLPTGNVSPDTRFIALMQMLHRRGIVLSRLRAVDLKERLRLTDSGIDCEAHIAEVLEGAARRVFVPVTSRRVFRWTQQILAAGMPLPTIPAARARTLAVEALAIADKDSQAAAAQAALKRQLAARFAPDRAAVARLYLPDWRSAADSGAAGEVLPDAALDLLR